MPESLSPLPESPPTLPTRCVPVANSRPVQEILFQASVIFLNRLTQGSLVAYSGLVPESLSPLPESSPILPTRGVLVAYSRPVPESPSQSLRRPHQMLTQGSCLRIRFHPRRAIRRDSNCSLKACA